ncbi:reverse transcriptase domain-containing protein [Sphingomonas dokdonensis]|uniref:Reverse transcriptase n=1 Tax=Sphingomonas dokdonensis TaxID=344880 RepID=A0A245ZL07_9SPHN|nr:reverse transcriptase domain-containing protein [Sphingomonas dokdonensis]OWK30413.1 reverse transcriptase [Sphingomonas dokdonensis]
MSVSEREAVRQARLADVLAALPRINRFSAPALAQTFKRPKPHGGERILTTFFWEDDARVRVLKSALTPFVSLHDSQFMLAQNGCRRGPASVREALLRALGEEKGDHVFLQFDVRDFFGSISHAWLEKHLGLDRGIVRRFVHTGEMLIVPSEEMRGDRLRGDARKENGRSGAGIPQGSALSSLIAEMVMAEILRSDAVFDRGRLFTWSDNLGILIPRGEAGVVEELIRAAFGRHEAGPFHLSSERKSVTSEFKFLGTWYCVEAGLPRAFIPEAVARGWADNVCADILTADEHDLELMEQRVRGKEAAWGWWSGMADISAEVRALIWAAREASSHKPH